MEVVFPVPEGGQRTGQLDNCNARMYIERTGRSRNDNIGHVSVPCDYLIHRTCSARHSEWTQLVAHPKTLNGFCIPHHIIENSWTMLFYPRKLSCSSTWSNSMTELKSYIWIPSIRASGCDGRFESWTSGISPISSTSIWSSIYIQICPAISHDVT